MLTEGEDKIYFGGRMGSYKYLNMDETINLAMELAEKLIQDLPLE